MVAVLVPVSLVLAVVVVPVEPRRGAFEPGDAVLIAAAVGQMAGVSQPEPVRAVPMPFVRGGAP